MHPYRDTPRRAVFAPPREPPPSRRLRRIVCGVALVWALTGGAVAAADGSRWVDVWLAAAVLFAVIPAALRVP